MTLVFKRWSDTVEAAVVATTDVAALVVVVEAEAVVVTVEVCLTQRALLFVFSANSTNEGRR